MGDADNAQYLGMTTAMDQQLPEIEYLMCVIKKSVRMKPRGRPRLKPGPAKPPKKFRNDLMSYEMKWAGLQSFDEVGMAETLARYFPYHDGGRLGLNTQEGVPMDPKSCPH
ncbi:hypothetical protein DYB35_014127 [Aphanomyces astaci]|uniref:Uncharacterized protein n=1 Tax=Aphanomyces astaci TaxID=112090 RepID=A0A3R7A372_APHAT|nr:hypothetical protein DYB35_014127 [Aphanomyces astaci]